MRTASVKIYSIADGELPDTHKAKVIGLQRSILDGSVSLLTLPHLWWNARKKLFYWHITPEREVDYWFYESELVKE